LAVGLAAAWAAPSAVGRAAATAGKKAGKSARDWENQEISVSRLDLPSYFR
jgi:hypothetical protein